MYRGENHFSLPGTWDEDLAFTLVTILRHRLIYHRYVVHNRLLKYNRSHNSPQGRCLLVL